MQELQTKYLAHFISRSGIQMNTMYCILVFHACTAPRKSLDHLDPDVLQKVPIFTKSMINYSKSYLVVGETRTNWVLLRKTLVFYMLMSVVLTVQLTYMIKPQQTLSVHHRMNVCICFSLSGAWGLGTPVSSERDPHGKEYNDIPVWAKCKLKEWSWNW